MKRLIVGLALVAAICSCDARRRQPKEDTRTGQVEQPVQETAGVGSNTAPDFTLKDIDGKNFKLSSLRGKYVVLDFWGSWCGWCIKGVPDMKQYYAKYKEKMEIVGVDCNDTPEQWKAAVQKYAMPWKHVYCDKDSDVPAKYRIEGFPTKIVIDPQGNVVKIIKGERPEFYRFLDELFSK